jgi:hypothetical protein
MNQIGLAVADLIDVKFKKKVQVVVTSFDIDFIKIEQLEKMIERAKKDKHTIRSDEDSK